MFYHWFLACYRRFRNKTIISCALLLPKQNAPRSCLPLISCVVGLRCVVRVRRWDCILTRVHCLTPHGLSSSESNNTHPPIKRHFPPKENIHSCIIICFLWKMLAPLESPLYKFFCFFFEIYFCTENILQLKIGPFGSLKPYISFFPRKKWSHGGYQSKAIDEPTKSVSGNNQRLQKAWIASFFRKKGKKRFSLIPLQFHSSLGISQILKPAELWRVSQRPWNQKYLYISCPTKLE